MSDTKKGYTWANPEFPYINRELSWLDFNERVLGEAKRKSTPVLERLKFLSITASNLDEFFMVRVANLREEIRLGYKLPDATGMNVAQQYEKVIKKCHTFMKWQYDCLNGSIFPALEQLNFHALTFDELNDEQEKYAKKYFRETLFPILTPMAIDSSRPFPFLANRSLNLAVRLKKDGKQHFGVVQIPSIVDRMLELPSEDGYSFIFIEEIIKRYIKKLFSGCSVRAVCAFSLTRNSDLHIDEHADDILAEVQKSIKKRKKGNPVRLELQETANKNETIDEATKRFLIDELKVKKDEVFICHGQLDLTAFMKLAMLPRFAELRLTPIVGRPAADFEGCEDIYTAIRERDRMVFHPYESFDCVTRFLQTAANDPKVLAIKQTLYRVSGHSPIVAALMQAAENGKQVTVLVELKARFDEENNIQWAKKLEKAGCHVIYGFPEMKTHCKLLLIVRSEDDGIHRYLHLSTGNYNDSTAKLYTDVGLFTCNETFIEDASALFNGLTGYTDENEYKSLIVAPQWIRPFFKEKIKKEIENSKAGLPCGITIKVNSLLDDEMVHLLYDASQAGVPIKLIVRGICSIVSGIKGISENISIISIVGQLLEHSRIFKFENCGDPQYYMGSADLMPRNLDRRIEALFPILDSSLKERSQYMLDTMLSDTYNARVQRPDGSFVPSPSGGHKRINSQCIFAKEQ